MTDAQPLTQGSRRTGDALAFAKSLADGSVDVVTTDPPWDLPGQGLFLDAAPYDLQGMEYLGDVMLELRRATKPGGLAFVFAPSAACFPEALDMLLKHAGWTWVREVVWDKSRWSTPGLGRPWKNAHEPVFVVANGKPRKAVSAGLWPTILAQRPLYTRTSKPPSVYEVFLKAGSLPGELAVDPFCGLDPLADAAANTGRSWISNDALTPAEVLAQAKRRRGDGQVRAGDVVKGA